MFVCRACSFSVTQSGVGAGAGRSDLPISYSPAGVWYAAMASRAFFRMGKRNADAAHIPDEVTTINDLKCYVRRIYNIPSSAHFQLRAWTNKGSKKGLVVLKGDQYIIDLEDNHSGERPLLIYPYWEISGERKKELRDFRARQTPEFEDGQKRRRRVYLPVKLEVAAPPVKLEVAAPEIEDGQGHTKRVCDICRCAECDGISCDPHDFIQNQRRSRCFRCR